MLKRRRFQSPRTEITVRWKRRRLRPKDVELAVRLCGMRQHTLDHVRNEPLAWKRGGTVLSWWNIQIPEQLLQTPPERFFKTNSERTRGHSQKLFKKRARLDQKKNFFPVKIVGKWNDLPANVVEAATIGSFKRRLMNHRPSLVTS